MKLADIDKDVWIVFCSLIVIWGAFAFVGFILGGFGGLFVGVLLGGAVAPMIAFMVIGVALTDKKFGPGSGL